MLWIHCSVPLHKGVHLTVCESRPRQPRKHALQYYSSSISASALSVIALRFRRALVYPFSRIDAAVAALLALASFKSCVGARTNTHPHTIGCTVALMQFPVPSFICTFDPSNLASSWGSFATNLVTLFTQQHMCVPSARNMRYNKRPVTFIIKYRLYFFQNLAVEPRRFKNVRQPACLSSRLKTNYILNNPFCNIWIRKKSTIRSSLESLPVKIIHVLLLDNSFP